VTGVLGEKETKSPQRFLIFLLQSSLVLLTRISIKKDFSGVPRGVKRLYFGTMRGFSALWLRADIFHEGMHRAMEEYYPVKIGSYCLALFFTLLRQG
jgi:hypothetical protein